MPFHGKPQAALPRRSNQLVSSLSRTRCSTLRVAVISRSDRSARLSSRRASTMPRISFSTGCALRPSTLTLLRRSVFATRQIQQRGPLGLAQAQRLQALVEFGAPSAGHGAYRPAELLMQIHLNGLLRLTPPLWATA